MSNKENRILNDSGAQYPFKVPEGYFDNLTARIMEQIPEEKQETIVVSMTPRKNNSKKWISALSIAASLALVAIISPKMMKSPGELPDNAHAQNTIEYSEEDAYNEDFVMYSMVDNSDIYDYLSGGYEN